MFYYKFHDDFRGDGKQVFEEDGSYYSYTTQMGQIKYKGKLAGFSLSATAYLQNELYYRQNESMNSSDEYRLYETNSIKRDMGVLLQFSRKINYHHQLSFGADIKRGVLDAVDDYMTSSDSLSYKGSLDFTGFFVQDEMKYFSNRLHITMGLRADIARFYNGSLRIENPTNITGFTENSFTEFDNNTWLALSPKLAARYKLIEKLSAYASVASGFMPPKLNDLCQSGKIRKGFKLANPDLGPKTLWNYEIGMDYSPAENLKIASSMYYSHGYNFHNLVGTGDSIDTGGTDLKPVLRKLNISEIEIRGIELFFNWKINRHFRFLTNYAYAKSTILDFDKNNDSDEINGNYIIEVPPHTLYAGLFYSGKLFDASLDYSYTDAIWADIQNTQQVEPYDIWNFKISRNFAKHWNMGITLQNFFDNEFIDRKGRKSPGRFNMVEISYRW